MSETPPSVDRADEPRPDPAAAGTPRWVKVFIGIALVAAILVVILLVSGRGGGHGPGRHAGAAVAGADTPAADLGPARQRRA
jgi:hypothetical protein